MTGTIAGMAFGANSREMRQCTDMVAGGLRTMIITIVSQNLRATCQHRCPKCLCLPGQIKLMLCDTHVRLCDTHVITFKQWPL